jgi:hypothetical protein
LQGHTIIIYGRIKIKVVSQQIKLHKLWQSLNHKKI